MPFHVSSRSLLRVSALVILSLIPFIQAVHAQDDSSYRSISLSISFGYDQFGSNAKLYDSTPLGATPRLSIYFGNTSPHSIQATSLQCTQQGASLSASSISRLPNTVVFAPGQDFWSEQYYRAVAPGTTGVQCVLKWVDLVTHESFMASSSVATVYVSGDTRLYANAYSATQTATPGQSIFLTVIYGNRGVSVLTDIDVDCGPANRSISIAGKRQTMTTLRPGESGFVEYRLLANLSGGGGFFRCNVTAIDSYLRAPVGVSAMPVSITIR